MIHCKEGDVVPCDWILDGFILVGWKEGGVLPPGWILSGSALIGWEKRDFLFYGRILRSSNYIDLREGGSECRVECTVKTPQCSGP